MPVVPTANPGGNRLRIVIGGYLGLLPAGGITWDYVQYVAGFAELGHDVFYIEDTRVWPIYHKDATEQPTCEMNVAHLSRVMSSFGLDGHWAYRDEVTGTCFGMSLSEVKEVCRTADVFVNISCSTFLRDEYRSIPVRILIDSDPMFTQIQYATRVGFTAGESGIQSLIEGHTHHFTFGESVGEPGCLIPQAGVKWRPTRQPICLDEWRSPPAIGIGSGFTTVMNWMAGEPLHYDGDTWGQKDVEFQRVLDIPSHVDAPFAMVVGQTTGDPFPLEATTRAGWQVLDPNTHAPDWLTYREFIRGSLAEFSVAKETYVKARTGWFSCRSACYLASSRPVITQDTGWTRHVPSGTGLIGFTTFDEAVAGLDAILTDPKAHALAAREIAEENFDSHRVLGQMLEESGAA
ncbi:MAG: hypothetical protein ABIW94_12370 [Gemmatimonadaceae bacterium]